MVEKGGVNDAPLCGVIKIYTSLLSSYPHRIYPLAILNVKKLNKSREGTMNQMTEEKKEELNSLVASITNRPYTESTFNLEREDTKVSAGGGQRNDFTVYPLNADVIVTEAAQEETAVLPATSLAIDAEFSGLAVSVVGAQLADSEGRLAELRE